MPAMTMPPRPEQPYSPRRRPADADADVDVPVGPASGTELTSLAGLGVHRRSFGVSAPCATHSPNRSRTSSNRAAGILPMQVSP